MTSKAISGLRIRAMQVADLPFVLQIVSESSTAPQWSEAHFRQMLGKHSGAPVPLVRQICVAEVEGVIAGFAVASALKVVFPTEAELESIAVDPVMRGQGIGRALVMAVRSWAQENGADELRLEVRQSNGSALALYRALHFRETGIRRNYYVNPTEDAICMAHAIPSRDFK